ncbi:hypothetical protein LSUE1_G009495 [Lachnellula suecica]|uniref:EthD domain-containing protein n=1 Tax=Lachnellula suecica TaxID=602035 RepID=A0A8T9BSZ8_9HELO|nr:hypothetical protein LSUE1_G009495 [Lachnellula suecica]
MAAQSLLKRSPNMTLEEFKEQWLRGHAPKAVPLFLHFGVEYYVQIHAPLTTTTPDLDLTPYSVAGEATAPSALVTAMTTGAGTPQWVLDYYREVVLVDERRCLLTDSMKHMLPVPPGTVNGVKEVIIREGICEIEVPEAVWEVR